MNWLSKQPQVIKPQPMLVTKVFLPDSEIRRTKLSATSFSDLCHELSCNFLTEEERNQVLKLKYRDDRNDWVTFDTEEEFQDAVEILRYEKVKNPTAALCVSIQLEEKIPLFVEDVPPELEDVFEANVVDLPAIEDLPAITDEDVEDDEDAVPILEDDDDEDTQSSVSSVEEVTQPQEAHSQIFVDDDLCDDDYEEVGRTIPACLADEDQYDVSDDEDDEKEQDEDDEDDDDEYDEEMMRASAHKLSQSVGSLLSHAPHQVPVLPEPAYEEQAVPEPVEQITIPVQFTQQLQMLADMGIGNTKDNIEALEKHKGDVNALINALFQ